MAVPDICKEENRSRKNRNSLNPSSTKLPNVWNDSSHSEESAKNLSSSVHGANYVKTMSQGPVIRKIACSVYEEFESEINFCKDEKIDQEFLTREVLQTPGKMLSPEVVSRLHTVLDNVKDSHSGKVNTSESQTQQNIGAEKTKRKRILSRKQSTASAGSKAPGQRSQEAIPINCRTVPDFKQTENGNGIRIPSSTSRSILNRMGRSLTAVLSHPFKQKNGTSDTNTKIRKNSVKETKF